MKAEKSPSKSALVALRRASQIAENLAAERNLKIPIWKDGKVIFRVPKKSSQQID